MKCENYKLICKINNTQIDVLRYTHPRKNGKDRVRKDAVRVHDATVVFPSRVFGIRFSFFRNSRDPSAVISGAFTVHISSCVPTPLVSGPKSCPLLLAPPVTRCPQVLRRVRPRDNLPEKLPNPCFPDLSRTIFWARRLFAPVGQTPTHTHIAATTGVCPIAVTDPSSSRVWTE
ncbi:hypothetical protein AGLY_006181 [Aphis glycines]|uniref:Uncharacterized protein n=1 Tax=Aphis glycines TaxID=307491 RepID=A0A6G0TUA7_APHGL|nr:hypothetical protein AGLY_006181 [Aphis glycines]